MSWELHNADCMDVMRTLPDESVDLVIMDPPYYRVMCEDWRGNKIQWDRQWDDLDGYIGWLSDVLSEVSRVMKGTGSLYLFCDEMYSARIHLAMEERYRVLNHIVWYKGASESMKGWRTLRSYSPSTERILFAERLDANRDKKKGDRRPFHLSKPLDSMDMWHIYNRKLGNFHPTQKPLELVRRIIDTSTEPGRCATVLDPFAGSAAVGVECIRAGHRYIGCEKDPEMHARSLERLRATDTDWTAQRRLDAWA